MNSAIYKGWVRHRRHKPQAHSFTYKVFMTYLDLNELDSLFYKSKLWTNKPWPKSAFSPLRLCRKDYFGDPQVPLSTAVKQKIFEESGLRVDGPVRMLSNLRHFGFIINPLTIYYCFNSNEQLIAMLLEVTNTPWNERHQYVIKCDPNVAKQRINFEKKHHVSPFHPIDMMYELIQSSLSNRIHVCLRNIEMSCIGENNAKPVFDATLLLKREEISSGSLFKVILQKPFMTLNIVFAIYWQAFRLLLKRTPIYAHPRSYSGKTEG